MYLSILIIDGILAIIIGIVAGNKGRSKIGWFFLTMLCPLIGFIIFALKPKTDIDKRLV